MNTIPIRELQQRGMKALAEGVDGPFLVVGRPGALFYLIPADRERLAEQEVELSRAMARANLRSWQSHAVESGTNKATMQEIEEEIATFRKGRSRRSADRSRTPHRQ